MTDNYVQYLGQTLTDMVSQCGLTLTEQLSQSAVKHILIALFGKPGQLTKM